jgi:hypothetical protein
MRYIFYTLLNLLLLNSVFAQSNKFHAGEILLKNGLQKTGYILGQFHLEAPKGVYFKPDEVTKSEYLEFSDIQEVRFGETLRYITHCTKNTAQERCHWLKTLLIGKVSLYQSAADEGLYFMEEGGIFNGIRSPSFEGTLNLLKRKCEGFVAPVDAKFGTETLIKMTVAYNQCKNPNDRPQLLYVPEEPPKWFFGPKLGANTGNAYILETPFYHRTDYIGSTAFSTGVVLQLQTKSRLAVQTELNFFYRTITNDTFNFGQQTNPLFQTLKVKLNYLELPLLLQFYLLKNKKVDLLVQGGVHTLFPIKRDFYGISLDGDAQTPYRPFDTKFTGLGLGFSFGAGAEWRLTEDKSIRVLAQRALFSNTLDTNLSIYPERIMEFYFQRFQLEASLLYRLKSK